MYERAIDFGTIKQLCGTIAIGMTLAAFYPYIRSIWKGETKPHVFTWIIWGLTTFLAFLAQLAGGAGFGAWSVGVSGIISIYTAALAYRRRADVGTTWTDWLFFWAAMSAVPLWLLTSDPLWATVVLTTVDVLGFGPTMRKVYHAPFHENLSFYVVLALRNIFVVVALESYNLTTMLFPLAVAAGCVVLIVLVLWRRRVVDRLAPISPVHH